LFDEKKKRLQGEFGNEGRASHLGPIMFLDKIINFISALDILIDKVAKKGGKDINSSLNV
jgi:hypothetical protein